LFAGADLQASADQSVRLSARRYRPRLDSSSTARPRTDAPRVAAPGISRPSCRLNRAFTLSRPRRRPWPSIPIRLSISAADHIRSARSLAPANVFGPTLTEKTSEACGAASAGDAALRGARAQPTARLQAGGD